MLHIIYVCDGIYIYYCYYYYHYYIYMIFLLHRAFPWNAMPMKGTVFRVFLPLVPHAKTRAFRNPSYIITHIHIYTHIYVSRPFHRSLLIAVISSIFLVILRAEHADDAHADEYTPLWHVVWTRFQRLLRAPLSVISHHRSGWVPWLKTRFDSCHWKRSCHDISIKTAERVLLTCRRNLRKITRWWEREWRDNIDDYWGGNKRFVKLMLYFRSNIPTIDDS